MISVPPGAEASERAGLIAKQADVVAALTLEVLKGTSRFKHIIIAKMMKLSITDAMKDFVVHSFIPFLRKEFAGLLTAMCTPCVHTRASSWSYHPHFHHQF